MPQDQWMTISTASLLLPLLQEGLRSDLAGFIEAMPASRLIGLKVLGFAPGGISAIALPLTPSISFDGISAQGGIVGMLADYAGVSAAASMQPQGWACMTLGYQVNNLAPARHTGAGAQLVAAGRVRHSGSGHCVSTVDVWACDGELANAKLVATATTQCRPFQVV